MNIEEMSAEMNGGEMTKEAVERAEIMNGFANCVCYLAMAKDRLRAMGADV